MAPRLLLGTVLAVLVAVGLIGSTTALKGALGAPPRSSDFYRNKASVVSFSSRPTQRCLSRSNRSYLRSLNGESKETLTGETSSRTSSPLVETKQTLLNELAKDFDRLSEIRSPSPSADTSLPDILVSAGSSYTRIWTHDTWKSHTRPPHVRYRRHILRWHCSSTARVILPAVFLFTTWATGLSMACRIFGYSSQLFTKTGSSAVLSLLSAPLALLLTLRANTSMSRLLEARLHWGRLLLHSRGLSNILRTYVFDMRPHAAILAVRHLAVLPWILKSTLRGEERWRDEEVLKVMLGDTTEDYNWVIAQPKTAVALVARMRQICALAMDGNGTLESAFRSSTHLIVEERIRELEIVIGACSRIFTSPIPPTYSRHLSRVLALWLLLTPVSLIASGLPTVGVSLATAVAAYVLIGIDEVGLEIESAFPLLPLQQLCGATQNDVRNAILTEMPQLRVM